MLAQQVLEQSREVLEQVVEHYRAISDHNEVPSTGRRPPVPISVVRHVQN